MNKAFYAFKIDDEDFSYTFVSVGVQGEIVKIIVFQPIQANIFNLLLGNFDPQSGHIDDTEVSNNGDMPKIFATIFQIANHFLEHNPEKLIYVEANTKIKHKLYTRIIRNNLKQIETQYRVFGVLQDETFEIFKENTEYTAYIIKKIQNENH